MADDTQQQPAPIDQNALLQALIQQQLAAASGQGQQVQLPSLPAPQAQTQYSNDPDKGPGLLARIGLALGGGSLPGAPAELRSQMGAQALMNFGVGLMGAGKFATPGEVLAGGFRGAQAGLLGSEAAQAGQQEYALNAQGKLLGLGIEQQKARTEALNAALTAMQLQGRLGLPPLFGPGSQAGPPGGGQGGGGGGDGQGDIYSLPKDQFLPAVAQRESGGHPTALNYVAKADPSAIARGATASGKYQMVNSTWQTAAKAAGIDTNKYPTAASAPEALQDQAASKLYDMQGTAPWNPSKWTKNWVQGSDGKYTLQTAPYTGPPGASKGTPPTQGAGGPVGPYKPPGASTATAGSTDDSWFPSATPAPPAGGGGQLSIGDVALPPAKGSAANVVPGLSAADATVIAKRTGQDVPFGDQGMVAHPSGRVGTAGGGGFGKRADAGQVGQDVAAIQAGMQGGGGGAPDTVVQAAGPAAGGPPGIGSALAPPTPGLAASIGPITTPAAPAPPPAAQPQPPAAQPAQPPAPPATTEYPGDVQATPEQYMREHYQAATPEEVARYAPGPTGEAARNAAQKVQDAQGQLNAARTQLDQIRRGAMPGDPNKAMSDVQAAQNELDKNRSAYDEEVQKLAQSGAGNLLTRDNAEKTRVSQNYQKVQDREQQNQQQAQTLANNIRLKEIEGEQQRITNREAVGNKVNQDTLAQASKDQIDARNLATSIEGFQTMTANIGQPGWLQTTKNPFGQGETIAEKLGQMGVPVNDTGGIQAMQAGINEMIKSLRAGMPMGSLSDRDLDFIRRMGPTEWMDPDTRMAVTSYIRQAARAKQQFSYEIQKNLSKPGANAADAIEAADAKVKSFVPEVPFSSSQWSDRSPDGTARRMQWLQDHPLPPGTLYHLNDGSVMISKRPGSQQPARPQSGPAVGYGNQ